MAFNTFEYLFFLPIVFMLYWFVFKPRRWQNLLIVLASYVFYGWWDWRFLILIAFTSLCSYEAGLLIERSEGNRSRQKFLSAANIIINLAILGIFKYFNFFIDNFAVLCRSFGVEADWPTLNVILPVGISFYTFQALSYSIDVYRGNIRATKDPVEFFAYISFFPQLVAGPIERATNLLPQFQRERTFQYDRAVDGCRQILWGLFKKVVVADNCALMVNKYWDVYDTLPSVHIFLLVLFFTFQIYGDFSGYSDIAIGSARLFGINLMRNFNVPYFSRSIPEFWRRWHISLMTWFRDYIYFPLGGSRCSRGKVIRNTLIVFGVSGLWHGANWTFVCWGLYHALLISLYILLGINTKNKDIVASDRALPSLKELGQMLLTFVLAMYGWLIFRAENMGQVWDITRAMFTNGTAGTETVRTDALIFCGLLLVIEWIQRKREHALDLSSVRWRWLRWTIYVIFVVALFALTPRTFSEFIYFQF